MTKKNQKRKRRKRPLKADPNRQANASLRGYRYQILHSVDAWLDLTEGESLYLEGVEDFDIVSNGTATVVQIKDTQHNITLNSKEVIKAINHFWKSRTENSDRHVKFRFITRSEVGVERDKPFGNHQQGLRLWSRCSGEEETIKKISEFLQNQEQISNQIKDFLNQADDLQKIFEQLIKPINWETGSPDAITIEQSISEKVILQGNELGLLPFDSNKVFDALLNEAFTVATHGGNRELTKRRFLKIFEEETTQRVSTQHLRHLQMLATQAARDDTPRAEPTGDPSDVTIQSYSPIQTVIPPLYPDVFQRTELLTSIQIKLQSDGIAIIQGGTGKGKTTLTKLTANGIDSGWFWLNFTNRDMSQVRQYLQQLASAVNSQSVQVNVVLDDLNLQPQELRGYEETLGAVIYGILERGAKLLITSQHKPPPNFTRSLGLSSSVGINVPNFTESEIKQFAEKMGGPANDIDTWVTLIQAHTGGHPRLVHAWLVRLQEEGWDEQDIIKNLLQPSEEIVEEREAARQLLTNLPENQREFLYRLSLMSFGFSEDYAKNIAEIPEPISYPGDVFSQLVGPWIDPIDETYYTISPLLRNAANKVWTESKINDLHAHIANAILKTKEKTKKLTTADVYAVLTHSMVGQNKVTFIAVMDALMTAPEDDWEKICQEFSWITHVKTKPPDELFPGETFVNQMFRSLQYSIAVEMEPELAPKILGIWDKETKPYEPRQSYMLSRLMIATEILQYNQMQLPAKKLVGYLKEMIDIKNTDKEVWKSYFIPLEELKERNIDESNFFSFLFSLIYMRPEIDAVFLNEIIDTLDKLDPKIRTLLLVDFENDTVQSQLLNNGVWLTEEKLENPNWSRCLETFDKVIEKTIAWGYPYIAAASARIKAITHDEKLNDPDTAHEILQDITSKLGTLPTIEEARAVVYLNQKRYKDALDIYDNILRKWDPLSEQSGIGPLEEYRRAAICAANLDDWKKAAAFFEEGANKTKKIENTERYISGYADAGFAYFKAGNMLNCIKLLHLTLQNFEKLPQDNTNVRYFTLKKRLEYTIKWVWMIWCGIEDNSSELSEPAAGFCSDQETNEKVLDLPDSPIGYSWLFLAQIEYRFGHETTVFQHALQTRDREECPMLNFHLAVLEAQYDYRNKTFDSLPQRIHQLAEACISIQKYHQNKTGIGDQETNSISMPNPPDFTSVANITFMLVSSLLVKSLTDADTHEMLAIWRTNSTELPIKEKVLTTLDLIETTLLKEQNNVLTMIEAQDTEPMERLVAALRIVCNSKTDPKHLFYAHAFIAQAVISNLIWIDPVMTDIARLLSAQWLEKIEFRAALKMPMVTVPEIEKACKSSETGKKKIGQILLAVHPAVSTGVPPEILQEFRAWAESESKQGPATRKNPAAQRLIKAMEEPPHLTDEDIEELNQSIEEGKIPINYDSPFDLDEDEDDE